MNITVEEQAKNAIQWIDTLPNYKQADYDDRRELGCAKVGYCCLGAGCVELGVTFERKDGVSKIFQNKVGLMNTKGKLYGDGVFNLFYGKSDLTNINDYTHAGFKRIEKLLRTKPHWMFTPEVADLITEHYNEETK